MRIQLTAGLLAALCGSSVCGQDISASQNTPTRQLRVAESFPVSQPPDTGIFDKIRCDADRNVYVRYAGDDAFASPITKVSAKGETLLAFNPRLVGWDVVQFYGFTVTPKGAVSAIGARAKGRGPERTMETGIAVFKENGQFDFFIRTDGSFSPEHIAAFPDGNLLVTGWQKPTLGAQGSSKDSSQQPVVPFAAIFDRRGIIISRVAIGPPGTKFPVSALSMGNATPGGDGNIYVLIHSEKANVHVIGPSGETVRHFEVEPPIPKMAPLDLRWAGDNQIFIQFAEKGPREDSYVTNRSIFAEINATSGETLAFFQTNPEVGGVLGCYANSTFLFLGYNSDKRRALLHVKPQ